MNNIVLSIAGSDSGAGAGIQADIKSIAATGSYCATAISAITSQNTIGVYDILEVGIEHLESQIDAVFTDFKVTAVKIGMLSSSKIIKCVIRCLKKYETKNIVLDPVMIAQSGDKLINDNAIQHMKDLCNISDIITPNIPEAKVLLDTSIDDMYILSDMLYDKYNTNILLKGGHAKCSENSNDIFNYNGEKIILESPRIDTKNTHGTGCSLSSAVASYISQGDSYIDSVKKAKIYVYNCLLAAKDWKIGKGASPIKHF